MEQKLEAQKAAVNAALDNGDAEQLLKIEDEQKLTRAKIRVLQHKLSALDIPCTQEEMQDAWTAYAQNCQKELANAEAVFVKHRHELCEEYRKMVEIQNAALKTREEFASLLGVDVSTGDGQEKVQQLFKMSYIPHHIEPWQPMLNYAGSKIKHAEPLYFRAVNDMDEDEFDKMNAVLRLHKYRE